MAKTAIPQCWEALPTVAEYAAMQRERYESERFDFLRIPSASTLPDHKPDIERAAEDVRAQMEQAGLESVEVIRGDGHPLVYSEWLGAPASNGAALRALRRAAGRPA